MNDVTYQKMLESFFLDLVQLHLLEQPETVSTSTEDDGVVITTDCFQTHPKDYGTLSNFADVIGNPTVLKLDYHTLLFWVLLNFYGVQCETLDNRKQVEIFLKLIPMKIMNKVEDKYIPTQTYLACIQIKDYNNTKK